MDWIINNIGEINMCVGFIALVTENIWCYRIERSFGVHAYFKDTLHPKTVSFKWCKHSQSEAAIEESKVLEENITATGLLNQEHIQACCDALYAQYIHHTCWALWLSGLFIKNIISIIKNILHIDNNLINAQLFDLSIFLLATFALMLFCYIFIQRAVLCWKFYYILKTEPNI